MSGRSGSRMEAEFARIRDALHPLESPPESAPTNLRELEGLLPDDHVPTPAAVLVGLVPRGDVLHVVLTLRNRDLRQHAGQVSFPGGRAEDEDTGPLATALRETEEEIGLSRQECSGLVERVLDMIV